jgi:hypothetical protein
MELPKEIWADIVKYCQPSFNDVKKYMKERNIQCIKRCSKCGVADFFGDKDGFFLCNCFKHYTMENTNIPVGMQVLQHM